MGLLLALPLAVSCGRLDRVAQCNRVARTVNEALARLEARQQQPGPADAKHRDLAAGYRKLAKDLTGLSVAHPALQDAVDDYRLLAEQTATELEKLGQAPAQRKKPLDTARARRPFEALQRREQMLHTKLQAACRH